MTKWKVRQDDFGRWVVYEPSGHEWTFGKWEVAHRFAYLQASQAVSEVP